MIPQEQFDPLRDALLVIRDAKTCDRAQGSCGAPAHRGGGLADRDDGRRPGLVGQSLCDEALWLDRFNQLDVVLLTTSSVKGK